MKAQCLVVAVVIALFSGISKADSIYAVTGDLTITGNNGCGGPCIETVNFSFELGYQTQQASFGTLYVPYIVSGTMTATSSGPLDSLIGSDRLGWDRTNYIPFYNGSGIGNSGDEIDLIEIGGTLVGIVGPYPDPPTFPSSNLFFCGTDICRQDFFLGLVGPVKTTVVPVSEGSELAMFGIASVAILGVIKLRHLAAPNPVKLG